MNTGSMIRGFTTLRVVVAGLLALLLGLVLLYVAGRDDWMGSNEGLKSVLDDVGGLLVASVALGTLWELAGKRAFAREVLASARIATDATAAGLVSIGTNYLGDPDWARLFADVQKLDIFFAYGRTWRNSNDIHLRSVAARRGARIRVFLPDPGDSDTLRRLSERFRMDPAHLEAAIAETRQYFADLSAVARGQVVVYHRGGDCTFSCYRFDKTAIVTLYTHRKTRTQVPTLICRDGGSLYEFVRAEFESIEQQSTVVT